MGASVTLEKTGLEQMFEFYGAVKQKTLPEVLRIHARLACVELARRTQPFGDKDSARFSGEKAIRTDLYGGKRSSSKGKGRAGIFAPLTPRQEVYAEFNDSAEIFVFRTKDGTVYGTDKAHFLPDASAATLREIHKGAFKNGRMSAAGGDTHNIGRWKYINKYFVPGSVLKEYLAAQQAKVGIAKSGWAWCAKQLKTGKGSATRGIPRWVTRHLGDYGLGTVQDLAEDSANPRIVLTNTCKYADKVCPPAQQQEAVLVVVNKMVKQLANMLRYERKQMKAAA